MKRHFPLISEPPPTVLACVSTFAGMLSVTISPLVLTLLMIGSRDNMVLASWLQIVYHMLNILLLVTGYREYLADSFFTVQIETDRLISTLAVAVGSILILSGGTFIYHLIWGEQWLALAMVPITETEMLMVNSYLVEVNPIFGSLCMILVVPFTISCMYYGSGFGTVCARNPWLGYLVVAVLIAIPRLAAAATYAIPSEELQLYLVQLPVHLIACWTYQKSDTIWGPIFTLMITNLLSCLLVIFLL